MSLFWFQPFYGGKVHRVSGEIKNPEGAISTKISGAWNGVMEFSGAVRIYIM